MNFIVVILILWLILLLFFTVLVVSFIYIFLWRLEVVSLDELRKYFFFIGFSIILRYLYFVFFAYLMNLGMFSGVISISRSIPCNAVSFIINFSGFNIDLRCRIHFAMSRLSKILARIQVQGLIFRSFFLQVWSILSGPVTISIFSLLFSKYQNSKLLFHSFQPSVWRS